MRTDQSDTVCLLPTGSAQESDRGISHLFEHIFITTTHRSCPRARVKGHTTEDYVILFACHISPREMKRVLESMVLSVEEVEIEKKILVREIERERHKEEEFFFKFVWEGTQYEKSPLGEIQSVGAIGLDRLEDLRKRLQQLFFFTGDSGVDIIPPLPAGGMPAGTLALHRKKSARFDDKEYDIYYFSGEVEAMYLLERILKPLNPRHHVQLSEKKIESALIVEKGARFPGRGEISSGREEALRQIDRELAAIRGNFEERALNELESVYFYHTPWSDRIDRLFQTTDNRLLALAARLTYKD